MIKVLVFILALFTLHCLNSGKSFDEVEPNALPTNVTWTEHAYPVLRARCNECHSSGPESKYGTVSGIDYSKYENAIPTVSTTGKDRNRNGFQQILAQAINSSSMPPGDKDKLTPYERALLMKWQDQGFAR